MQNVSTDDLKMEFISFIISKAKQERWYSYLLKRFGITNRNEIEADDILRVTLSSSLVFDRDVMKYVKKGDFEAAYEKFDNKL